MGTYKVAEVDAQYDWKEGEIDEAVSLPPGRDTPASYDERVAEVFKQTSFYIAVGKGVFEVMECGFSHGSIGQQLMGVRVAQGAFLAGGAGLWYPSSQIAQSLSRGERPSWSDVKLFIANFAELGEYGFRLAALMHSRYDIPANGLGVFADLAKANYYWQKDDRQKAITYLFFAASNASTLLAGFAPRSSPVSPWTAARLVRFAPRGFAAAGVVTALLPLGPTSSSAPVERPVPLSTSPYLTSSGRSSLLNIQRRTRLRRLLSYKRPPSEEL